MLLAISQGNILTYRQQEILKLIAQGKSAKEIVRELQISPNTVECHLANIYRILNVNNRIKAINIARQKGYGSGLKGMLTFM